MTDTPHSQENGSSAEILQAPWLHQSYLMGHPLEQKERYAEALEVYNRVLEQDRKHILAHLLKGRVLFSLNRDEEALATFQQALQLAEQALHRNRADSQTWIYKGELLPVQPIKAESSLDRRFG